MSAGAFILAAAQFLAPGRDHHVLADAITARVDAEAPLFAADPDKRKTSAWLVAVAFRESSLTLDAIGDKGESLCAFQVGRTSGGTTAMLSDADLCVGAAFALLRTSMRLCPAFPLAWYAAGGDAAKACASTAAQRLSRDRMALALRLVRDVRVPTAKGAFVRPAIRVLQSRALCTIADRPRTYATSVAA